jgi:hypothetical protein
LSAILEHPLLADDLSLLKQIIVGGHLYLQILESQYGAEHFMSVGIGVVAAQISFQ